MIQFSVFLLVSDHLSHVTRHFFLFRPGRFQLRCYLVVSRLRQLSPWRGSSRRFGLIFRVGFDSIRNNPRGFQPMKASIDNMTTGPRTTRPPSCQWSVVSGLAVALLLLCASATTAHGQIYWDNISGSGVGGTGFWTVGGSNWNTASTGEDATLTTWANGDSAVFAGTAGVVTLFSSGLSANNVTVSTTGYEFTSSATSRGLIVTNTLTLDSNVSLKLTLNSGTL